MHYDTIDYTLENGVAVVTMDRADKMNALNTQMRAEIADAFRHASTNARVAVLTGRGRAFCSGQDLSDRANAAELDLERVLREEYIPMLNSIQNCRVPTISAVNGAAAGAGANLALAADVVIATQSAYFMQAFTRIGLMPDAGGTYWMPRAMGMAKAMGAALFADKITAEQADQWGLIWEHVADDDFEAHWWDRAAQLAEGPTYAYRRVKRALNATWNNDLDAQLALEGHLQGQCGQSRDFKEGIAAFTEKRPPKFEGR